MGFRAFALVMILLLCAPGTGGAQFLQSFRSAVVAPNFGLVPTGLAVFDCSDDGQVDAMTSNSTDGTITVFEQFDGELFPEDDILVGNVPSALTAAELNGDGIPDLVVANGNDSSVAVLLGLGGCAFDAPPIGPCSSSGRRLCVGFNPSGLATADLNGDDRMDIVVANEGPSEGAPGSVTVLLGNGDGSFSRLALDQCDLGEERCQIGRNMCIDSIECIHVAAEQGTRDVAVGDLNGDDQPDIIVANARSGSVSVFLGDGDGGVTDRASFATGPEPQGVAAGDFDTDGRLDVITADRNGDSISLLRGDGTGGLMTPVSFAVGTAPSAVAVARIDADDHLDVVATNNLSGDATVLFGDGAGGVSRTRSYVADGQPVATVISDLNDDGRMDIFTANVVGSDGSVAVLRNRGERDFHAVEDVAAASGPNDMAVGDFDGDGLVDVLVSHEEGTVLAFAADGNGSLLPPATFPFGEEPRAVTLADLDGDEILDVLVADNERDEVRVRMGRGAGALGEVQAFPTAQGPAGMVAGDFDADGNVDVAVTAFGPPGQVSVLIGNGDGTFEPFCASPAGDTPVRIAAGDLNGDGRDDLAVVSEASEQVSVLLSDGDCSFTTTATLPSQGPKTVILAHLENASTPGVLDLAVGNSTVGNQPSVSVYQGNGDGTFAPVPGLIRADRVDAMYARDFTGDGVMDLAVVDQTENAIRVLRGAGSGRFSPESRATVSRMPIAVVAADLNVDGRFDAATGNAQTTANNISVLLSCVGEPFPCTDAPGPAPLRADGNDDGGVSAADLIAVAREVPDGDGRDVEDVPGGDYAAGLGVDANGDGRVDTFDRLGVARRIFAGVS